MDKLTLFRQVHQVSAAIAEQLITQWGTSTLDGTIDSLLSDSRPQHAPSGEMLDALAALRAMHSDEFPQFASLTITAVAALLADNEHFKIVNAHFPHIGKRLIGTWGHATFYKYLEDLFADSRGGQRKGFPKEAGLAIFRLSQQHDEVFPKLAARNLDLWSQYQ